MSGRPTGRVAILAAREQGRRRLGLVTRNSFSRARSESTTCLQDQGGNGNGRTESNRTGSAVHPLDRDIRSQGAIESPTSQSSTPPPTTGLRLIRRGEKPAAVSRHGAPAGGEHLELRGLCGRCQGRSYRREVLREQTSRRVLGLTFESFRPSADTQRAYDVLQRWTRAAIEGRNPPGFALQVASARGRRTCCARSNAVLFDPPITQSWVSQTCFVQEGYWFDQHKASMRDDSEVSRTILLERAQRSKLLCWDDLGVQPRGDRGWVDEPMYLVFDARYENRLPTLISTNFDLSKPMTKLERVRDRILGLLRDEKSGRPRILALGFRVSARRAGRMRRRE